MSKPVKTRKVRTRKGTGGLVTVSRTSIYFPSQGDPEGRKHAAQKFIEAEATAKLMMVAIARSGVSLDLLDLPGTAKIMKANAEDYSRKTGNEASYPGESVVHECVRAIRETRDIFENKVEADGTLKEPEQPAAPSPIKTHEPRIVH